MYLYFNYPLQGLALDSLQPIALIHTTGAYLLITFVIIHLYLITTGHTIWSNLVAMITGWEKMDEEEAETAVEGVIESTTKHYVKSLDGDEKKNTKKKKTEE